MQQITTMELDTPEVTVSTTSSNPNATANSSNINTNNNSTNTNNNNINNTNGTAPDAMDSTTTNGNTSNNTSFMVTTNGLGPSPLKSSYDTDVVRLIGQYLVDMGLKQTVELLMRESGLIGIDYPIASCFQQLIMSGDWDGASSLVNELASHSEGDKKTVACKMRLLIAEQKFLEMIDDDQRIKALKCLRVEIAPLTDDIKHVQYLTNLLICKSTEEVRLKANWPGKGAQSRQSLVEKFQRYVPPLIMLPPKRLSTLLSQAVELQRERCALHAEEINDSTYIDLKQDHVCSFDQFPTQSRQELDNHKTEVWFCKFSNDGSKLATGGLGGKIKIWDVDPGTRRLQERCSLDCNTYSITCLSWSPNDVFLLACGSEDRPDLWIWNVNKEEMHSMINHTDEECTTTCSWHMSGEKFAAASTKGNFNIYDLDGNRRGCREGVRVQCLSFLHRNPNYILAADHLNRIKSYATKDMSLETEEEDILEERHSITSFIIDRDDKYIAVNLMEQGVHLWDLQLKTLLRMFPGVLQRNFTIHSSFSSPCPTFLASGSEDGKVYIYHIHKNEPVAILQGHSRCVNCVTWNPKYPELLVSVSDDRFVRLWAPSVQRGQHTIKQETNGDS